MEKAPELHFLRLELHMFLLIYEGPDKQLNFLARKRRRLDEHILWLRQLTSLCRFSVEFEREEFGTEIAKAAKLCFLNYN